MDFTNHKEEKLNNKRLLIAVIISMIFMVIWDLTIKRKYVKNETQQAAINSASKGNNQAINKNTTEPKIDAKQYPVKISTLENKNIKLSIDANSGTITSIGLKNFKDKEGKPVELLNNKKINFGVISDEYSTISNQWKLMSETNNLIKIEQIANNVHNELDIELTNNDYLLKVTQRVKVANDTNITMYGRITNKNSQDLYKTSFTYSGVIGALNGKIVENEYKGILKKEDIKYESNNSWVGFTDQYWLTAIGSTNKSLSYDIKYSKDNDMFQLNSYLNKSLTNHNNNLENIYYIFTGPKNIELLHDIMKITNFDRFDKAIDFGMLYFISKPLLLFLKAIHNIVNNFGVAIIILTIIIRFAMLPLAIKAFKATHRMKALAPQLKILQESYKNDKTALQEAMLNFYKKNNINPFSTFLPILLQIPIFFALYKVFMISIEMRGAEFMFWIHDLSEPDRTSIFNLFGLLPFNVPNFLRIGVLPIVMGITMFVQQKVSFNPEQMISGGQEQKVQADIMKYMPFIFVFMSTSFPSGLVLYWTVSNTITIVQQIILDKVYARDSKRNNT